MKFIKFRYQTYNGPMYEYVSLNLFKLISYKPEDNSFYAIYSDSVKYDDIEIGEEVEDMRLEEFDVFLNSREESSDMKVFPIFFKEAG
jgi:hypothetical protein